MKEKLSKKQLKQIGMWIQEARLKLRMNDWEIHIEFVKKLGGDLYMEANSDPKYVRGTIKINEEKVADEWKRYGDGEIRNALYHEVIHIMMSPLTQLAGARYLTPADLDEEKERFTERLAKVISGHAK